MENKEITSLVTDVIDKKKGIDITIIDMMEKSSFADYFILASGRNERQIAGIADDVEDALSKEGVTPRNIEGKANSGWILLDYGDVIVNVLTAEMRERYNIEKLWGDCKITKLGDSDL